MSDADLGPPSPPPRSGPRRWRTLVRRLVVAATLALMALGAAGQVVRDRSATWALLMYLPLPLIGLGAIGVDILCWGRAWLGSRPRFALSALGLTVAVGSGLRLVAWDRDDAAPPPSVATPDRMRVLHWNVVWGGGRHRSPAGWAAIRRTIADQGADLIVLSEAPPDDWLDQLTADLGPLGRRVGIENLPGEPYWYKLAVASARPLRLVRREAVRNGVAMVVEAQVRPESGGGIGEVVRLLVVDGMSRPTQWRTPFLLDVAAACDRAARLGAPIDLVVGDFNSVGSSLGFDALADRRFVLASRSAPGQWHGTFPSVLPLYDIDHVWVAPRLAAGRACRLFTEFASDHRGQVVTLRLPGPPRGRSAPPP